MKDRRGCGKSVLVIEDETAIGRLCDRVLSADGFEVDVAHDGMMGQALMRKNPYDVYLIDVKMPGMTGLDLLEWMREMYPCLVNKVIFTTGSAEAAEPHNRLEQIGRPILAKPFTPEQLYSVVREAAGMPERQDMAQPHKRQG